MTQIKAIETHYAGCRFRSRLEARWAVFFDHLGIKWQYEPEGLLCNRRLTQGEFGQETAEKIAYLPDFYLPELGMWAEVKGRFENERAFVDFLDAAADIAQPGMGCTGDLGQGEPVLLLGPMAPPYGEPWMLTMHKGFLVAHEWRTGSSHGHGSWTIAIDQRDGSSWADITRWEGDPTWRQAADALLAGGAPRPDLLPAMHVAAQARFEHGESPKRP